VLQDALEDLARHRVVVDDQNPVPVDDLKPLSSGGDCASRSRPAPMNLDL
jgi:hypothetical protein